ncbi:MAG: IclR family transcriptional regulator [Terriglobia bacterium]
MAADSPSTAIDRALSILEALAGNDAGLTNSQISRRLDIPRSSASYILRALERRGYLRREPDTGKYHLGLKVLSLNRGVLSGLDLRELARPVLRSLVERSHLTAHLAVLDHGQAVYVEKAEAAGFIKMDTWVGRRMDVHSTSVGKALVAFRPKAQVEAILRQHGLRKRTPKTLTAPSKFFRELEKVRTQRYAVDDEENNLAVRCVAAPVFDPLGEVQAAVGVSGTISQLNKVNLPRIAALVQEAARKISKQLSRQAARRRE